MHRLAVNLSPDRAAIFTAESEAIAMHITAPETPSTSHASGVIFVCRHKGCKYVTEVSSDLGLHERSHDKRNTHATSSSVPVAVAAAASISDKPFACNHEGCDYRSAWEGNLADHRLMHTGLAG